MSRTISTSTAATVTLASGDNPVTILSGVTLSGGTTASLIGPLGTAWTVTNAGKVGLATDKFGIELLQGGTVVNSASASIVGTAALYIGVHNYGSAGVAAVPASVSNAGTVSGSTLNGFGVTLNTTGQVTNATTGLIQGHIGIRIAGSHAVVANLGSIAGAGSWQGVYLNRGGTVTNGSATNTTASIQGYVGIILSGGLDTTSSSAVFNYGTISDSTSVSSIGVELISNGSLINGGSGATGAKITGVALGAIAFFGGTLTNYGTIGATAPATAASYGVQFASSGGLYLGVVNNLGAVARIYGQIGVSMDTGTVHNAGTIVSSYGTTGTAVAFTGGISGHGGNRVIADPGAVFTGTIAGESNTAATNTLELAGTSAGTISQYRNFGTVTVDAGANWTASGSNTWLSAATIAIGTAASLTITGSVNATDIFQFSGTNDVLRLNNPTGTTLANTISGFSGGDKIILPGVSFQAGGSVVLAGGTLSAPLAGGGTFKFTHFTNAGTATPSFTLGSNFVVEAPCFLPGTLIRTDKGEVEVETLRIGDTIVTASGGRRPLCWIGHGKALATRGRRSAATPVIVRKGALGDNLPHRDLHITKGHALYLDDVLIPAEFLVNHRSILWDDRAQEVTVYHLELDAHDVLLANGVPAESYRDDGNRWLFQNANSGWDQPAKPPYAPVLTGGPVVDAVWQRILDRAGRHWTGPLTDDPDLHLLVDGVRVDPVRVSGDSHVFALAGRPETVRIASRAGVPQELGLARDARCLGVAVSGVAVLRGAHHAVVPAEDLAGRDGFHLFEPDLGHVWTDGDAAVPGELFGLGVGAVDIVLTVVSTTRYPDEGSVRRVA